MATTIMADLKQQFRQGNMIVRIIMVQLGVYILVSLMSLPAYLIGNEAYTGYTGFIRDWLYLPSDLSKLVTRPWTVFTYMLFHSDPIHIISNMLILYWFGRILNDLLPNNKILPLYLLGVLLGAVFFVAALNIFPTFQEPLKPNELNTVIETFKPSILGASAGVLAIVLATAVLHPRGLMYVFFIGEVQLRYIALAVILLDLVSIPVSNPGGHFAHLGGAVMGWFFIWQLRNGRDLSKPINRFFQFIGRPFARKEPIRYQKKEPQRAYQTTQTTHEAQANSDLETPTTSGYSRAFMQQYRNMSPQECVDAILDKIRRSGYNSLSEDEKTFLDKASREGKV